MLRSLILTIAIAGGAGLVAAEAPSPELTDEEFALLINDIDDAQDMLIGLISGVTDEQWNFKSSPERWSIAECVEHISRTQVAILNAIKAFAAGPPDPEWFEKAGNKSDFIRQTVLTRPKEGGQGFTAGGEVLPTEHWDRATGFREFYKSHGELRAYVETMPRAIKNRTFQNPFPAIGWMNSHDWLTLAALHVVRHSKQIAEVQADPNYPKK